MKRGLRVREEKKKRENSFFHKGFRKIKDFRYEGYAVGAGLAYGYAFALGTHWNLELEVGAGYVYTWFDRFPCKECGRKIDDGSHHYFGPTKAAVNIVYLF